MLPISEQYLRSPCEVKSMDNDPILTGTIAGITDEGIQVAGNDDTLPVIHCNTVVKINIYNKALGFQVLIGKVYLSTEEFIRIVDVQSVADYEKRNFFRVRVDIRTSAVILKDEGSGEEENKPEKPFLVRIRNLSLSGLFFVAEQELKVSDRVVVDLNISGTRLKLLCKVVRTLPSKLEIAIGYGCEFLGNTGRQFDLLCSYLFDCQREQIRSMKKQGAGRSEPNLKTIS